MSQLADDFWDDVDSVRRDAEALMSSSWTGDAARTHSELWAEWVESARQITGALAKDAALLHDAANAYSAAEARGTTDVIESGSRLHL